MLQSRLKHLFYLTHDYADFAFISNVPKDSGVFPILIGFAAVVVVVWVANKSGRSRQQAQRDCYKRGFGIGPQSGSDDSVAVLCSYPMAICYVAKGCSQFRCVRCKAH